MPPKTLNMRPMPATRKGLKNSVGKMRYLKGPYAGAKPGIAKKHYPNKTFEQQMGPRPIGT